MSKKFIICTLYGFDETYQQYVRLCTVYDAGMANLIISLLPHKNIYSQNGKGPATVNKYMGLKMAQVKAGRQIK